MTKIHIIFVLLTLLLWGCNQSSTSQELSEEQLREIVNQELENAQRAKFGNSGTDITIIEDQKQISALKSRLATQRAAEEKQIKSASNSPAARYVQGNKSGLMDIINQLKTGTVEAKKQVLNDLEPSWEEQEHYRIEEVALQKAIFPLLKETDIQRQAVQFIGYYKLAGYEDQFEQLFYNGELRKMGRVFYWLGASAKKKAPLEFFAKKVLNDEIDLARDSWFLSGFSSFYEMSGNQLTVVKKFTLFATAVSIEKHKEFYEFL